MTMETRPIMMLNTKNQAEAAADHYTSQELPYGPFKSDDGYIPWEIDHLSGTKMWRRPLSRPVESCSGKKKWWRSFRKQFESVLQVEGLPERFSYKQLKLAGARYGGVVQGKDEAFAQVYRGFSPSLSRRISVKKYDYKNHSTQAVEDFETAISIQSQLKHPNVVPLIGWCTDKEVYMPIQDDELDMRSKTLAKALFGQGRNFLTWPQRFKVLTDVAAAVAFLHAGSKQIVVHRNVQSQCVKFDVNENAMLGNFEIACVVDPQSEGAKTSVFSRSGYTCPQYLSAGIVTDKIDVYMFGVLALEIACGRPAVGKSSTGIDLLELVSKSYADGNLLSVVDNRLWYYDRFWVETVLNIALLCVQSNPLARPSMRTVVQMLSGEVAVPSLSSVNSIGLLGVPNKSNQSASCYIFCDPFDTGSSRTEICSTVQPQGPSVDPHTGYVSDDSTGKLRCLLPKAVNSTSPPTLGLQPIVYSLPKWKEAVHNKTGPFTSDDGNIPWEVDEFSGEKIWRRPVRSGGSDSGKKTCRWPSFWNQDPVFQVEGLPERLSCRELKVATRNFTDKSHWFRTSYGSHYRGVLPSSGLPVVVLRYYGDWTDYRPDVLKDFETAISIESHLKHRNVVRLLGWCENKWMLVHESMKGSLYDAMFGRDAQEGKFCLPWTRRFKILTDIAAALAYLHGGSKQIVVHRNVHCESILLDEAWNAKLGNFEIALVVDQHSGKKVKTVVSRGSCVCPAHSSTHIATDKTDVYAFGGMVLQVVCGRPRSTLPGGSLINLVRKSFTDGEHFLLVDPILREFDPIGMVTVLTIGLLCTHCKPEFRPSMKDVVQMLAGDMAVPSITSEDILGMSPTFCPVPII
ncbi:unnamed protein product [Calypogeia fissa]